MLVADARELGSCAFRASRVRRARELRVGEVEAGVDDRHRHAGPGGVEPGRSRSARRHHSSARRGGSAPVGDGEPRATGRSGSAKRRLAAVGGAAAGRCAGPLGRRQMTQPWRRSRAAGCASAAAARRRRRRGQARAIGPNSEERRDRGRSPGTGSEGREAAGRGAWRSYESNASDTRRSLRRTNGADREEMRACYVGLGGRTSATARRHDPRRARPPRRATTGSTFGSRVSRLRETEPVGAGRPAALPERRRRRGRLETSLSSRASRARAARRPSSTSSAELGRVRDGRRAGARGRSTSTCCSTATPSWTSPGSPCRIRASTSAASCWSRSPSSSRSPSGRGAAGPGPSRSDRRRLAERLATGCIDCTGATPT